MGTQYDDSRYGVEKVLTFRAQNIYANNDINATVTLTEDIYPIEFGVWVATQPSAAGVLGVMTLYKSGAALTELASATVPSSSPIGYNAKASALSTTSLASGDVVIVKLKTSGITQGSVVPYMKYRSRFITG